MFRTVVVVACVVGSGCGVEGYEDELFGPDADHFEKGEGATMEPFVEGVAEPDGSTLTAVTEVDCGSWSSVLTNQTGKTMPVIVSVTDDCPGDGRGGGSRLYLFDMDGQVSQETPIPDGQTVDLPSFAVPSGTAVIVDCAGEGDDVCCTASVTYPRMF